MVTPPAEGDPPRPLVGLTAAAATARLAEDGPNEFPSVPGPPAWRRFVGQFVHFFALMLWAAVALALVGGLPELAAAVFCVLLANGSFAFIEEQRSEHTTERLRDLIPRRVTVIRDGVHVDVDARSLVRGDLVVLQAGDRLSADLDAIAAHGLLVDRSALTGESRPVSLEVGARLEAGCFIVEGEGQAVVAATGSGTRLAGIAQLSRAAIRPPTQLALELRHLVQILASVAVAVGAVFFTVMLVLGQPASDGFVLAIGITVALVPEGLLPTLTLSLAVGAQRMAADHALVRHLDAVETLGSTTFICTDKTGTLTRNEMSVVQVWTPVGRVGVDGTGYEPTADVVGTDAARGAAAVAAAAARACSNGHAQEREGAWVAQGDPMEAAIDVLARRLDAGEPAAVVARFPFDPRRRRMSVVTADEVLVKGASDAVLPRCQGTETVEAVVHELAAAGLRVIAVARRSVGTARPTDADDAESGLELLGLIGLQDPPRADAKASVTACRRAGIHLAMVTGDHPATARAIADQVGLYQEGAPVVTGDDLPEDDDALGRLVDHDGIVLSRISPEQKLRIAGALQARGHVVAMTGDGVNDGPALQKADIGVAMGGVGTDVAREAADLVLLDDRFGTIVDAIEQGRAAYSNIRRFLTYHLTDNVAQLTPFAIWALTGGRFPLALGVLQVVAIDIGTDTIQAVALGGEPARPDVLDQPPVQGRLFDRLVARRAFGVLGPTEAVVEMTAFVVALLAAGWQFGDPEPSTTVLATASGAAFLALFLGQSANAFACRSTRQPVTPRQLMGNRFLPLGVLAGMVAGTATLLIPPVADALGQQWPSGAGLAVALCAVPAVILADAVEKHLRARRRMVAVG